VIVGEANRWSKSVASRSFYPALGRKHDLPPGCLTHDEVFAGEILAEGNGTRNGRVKVISGFEKDWHPVYFENVKEMAHYLSSLGSIRWFGYLSIRFDKGSGLIFHISI